MNTEVQTIAGHFTLPAEWPKLVFGDTDTGLIHDWEASSLSLGAFPSSGWLSSGSIPTTMRISGNTVAPEVLLDSQMNRNYIRFSDSQLTGSVSWTGDLTVVYILRPEVVVSNAGRALSGGGPTGNFRGLIVNNDTFEISINNGTGIKTNAFASQITSRKLSAIAGRWGASSFEGKAIGGDWRPQELTGGYAHQTQIIVGSNTASPPAPNSFLKADVFRIMVWDRVLSDIDIETVLAANSSLYGI